MNHYYYVPVTSDEVKHVGISLADHLKVVDQELYERGEVEKTFTDYDPVELDHMAITKKLYNERMLPEKLIIVEDENGFYELASMQRIQISSKEYLSLFEVTGFDILEIYDETNEYKARTLNFFDIYFSKSSEGDIEIKEFPKSKRKQFNLKNILRFFNGKNNK